MVVYDPIALNQMPSCIGEAFASERAHLTLGNFHENLNYLSQVFFYLFIFFDFLNISVHSVNIEFNVISPFLLYSGAIQYSQHHVQAQVSNSW